MKTIFVIPRGWVLVGNLEGTCLKSAKVSRRWGTTKGDGDGWFDD